jgi:hypothetical protein
MSVALQLPTSSLSLILLGRFCRTPGRSRMRFICRAVLVSGIGREVNAKTIVRQTGEIIGNAMRPCFQVFREKQG